MAYMECLGADVIDTRTGWCLDHLITHLCGCGRPDPTGSGTKDNNDAQFFRLNCMIHNCCGGVARRRFMRAACSQLVPSSLLCGGGSVFSVWRPGMVSRCIKTGARRGFSGQDNSGEGPAQSFPCNCYSRRLHMHFLQHRVARGRAMLDTSLRIGLEKAGVAGVQRGPFNSQQTSRSHKQKRSHKHIFSCQNPTTATTSMISSTTFFFLLFLFLFLFLFFFFFFSSTARPPAPAGRFGSTWEYTVAPPPPFFCAALGRRGVLAHEVSGHGTNSTWKIHRGPDSRLARD